MKRELLEELSIILEGIAFFLVTTDLYGEERLSALQKRLQAAGPMNAGQAIINLVFYSKKERILNLNVYLNILFFIVVLVYFFRYPFSSVFWNRYYLLKAVTVLVCGTLASYAVLYLLYMIIFFAYGMAFYLLSLLIKMLQLRPLKRIMLPLGTILFIASKVIAFRNISSGP